jgi:hypothetical protein
LVVSCGENVTAPEIRATAQPSLRDPVVVVMDRTTDIAAHDGVAAVHREFTETLTGQLRVASGAQPFAPSTRTQPAVDIAHLPRPSLALPARYETAMCSALPRWAQTMRTNVSPGGSVEMAGVGDAPASTLRIVENGKVVATVERTWVRTPRSWQLERQVTTSADGRYRDVVTYRRQTPAGQAVISAIPIAMCVPAASGAVSSPATASRSYYAPRGDALRSGTLSAPDASRMYGDDCRDTSSGIDKCYDKQLDVYRADVALVVAATAVTAACVTPVVVVVVPCVTATAAYAGAVAALAITQASLEHCRAVEAAKPPCTCKLEVSFSRGSAGALRAPAPLAMIDGDGSLGGSSDCSPDGGAFPTGRSSGSSGSGNPGCAWMEWEISFDGGVTWSYWGTFWTCL